MWDVISRCNIPFFFTIVFCYKVKYFFFLLKIETKASQRCGISLYTQHLMSLLVFISWALPGVPSSIQLLVVSHSLTSGYILHKYSVCLKGNSVKDNKIYAQKCRTLARTSCLPGELGPSEIIQTFFVMGPQEDTQDTRFPVVLAPLRAKLTLPWW